MGGWVNRQVYIYKCMDARVGMRVPQAGWQVGGQVGRQVERQIVRLMRDMYTYIVYMYIQRERERDLSSMVYATACDRQMHIEPFNSCSLRAAIIERSAIYILCMYVCSCRTTRINNNPNANIHCMMLGKQLFYAQSIKLASNERPSSKYEKH